MVNKFFRMLGNYVISHSTAKLLQYFSLQLRTTIQSYRNKILRYVRYTYL